MAAGADPQVERWSAFKVWLFALFNRDPKSNIAAIEMLGVGRDDHLIDLGCGLGAALEQAAARGARIAGIDPSPSMIARATERLPGADLRVGSAEAIPFPDGSFTVATAVATYHHWADREAGLAEVMRVLAPAGRLLIVEGVVKRAEGHGLARDEADALARDLETRGFEDARVEAMRVGRHDYLAIQARKPASV